MENLIEYMNQHIPAMIAFGMSVLHMKEGVLLSYKTC